MLGRVALPFDRGKECLWPLCLLLWRISPATVLTFAMKAVLCWLLTHVVVSELHSWWHHWLLANLISDWHRASLRTKMKAKGIHFAPRPLSSPIVALPHRWMVLSCIMLSMWRVTLARTPTLKPPVTWVTALGSVRDLQHPFMPPPPKPPDPSFFIEPASAGDGFSSTDEEGDEPESVNQLKPESLAAETADPPETDADFFEAVSDDSFFCRPCNPTGNDAPGKATTCPCGDTTTCSCGEATTHRPSPLAATGNPALNDWSDFDQHVNTFKCLLSNLVPSFGPLGLLSIEHDSSEALVDSCASMTVTPFKEDFIDYSPEKGKVLKGLTAGAAIKGRGHVLWNLEIGSTVVTLKIRALHVPAAEQRLLCPQQLMTEHEDKLKHCSIEQQGVRFHFTDGEVFCPSNSSNLPVMTISATKESAGVLKGLNACVTLENNQNLTMAQKELLKWHCRLGHVGFQRIQKLMRAGALGHSPKIKAAAHMNLDKYPFKCGSCEFGKAKRRVSRRNKSARKAPEPEKLLSKEVLIPGQKVSMDHFIVSTPGRLFNSRGSESHDRRFKGGVIFVDHATGYVFVEPVVNFTAGEAIRAKRAFEAEMSSMGVHFGICIGNLHLGTCFSNLCFGICN